MKKGTALLLAAVLALLCAASAHAGAVPWTDTDTSGYREVWYVDYGQTVANDIMPEREKQDGSLNGALRPALRWAASWERIPNGTWSRWT